MLVNNYKLEINQEVGCCTLWQSATASLSENISQALPNLVSAIKDAKYEPTQNSLHLVKDGSRHIYVYPESIYISCINNEEEAHTLTEWTKAVLNEAYSELTKITDSKKANK